jgi:hypothetical protein
MSSNDQPCDILLSRPALDGNALELSFHADPALVLTEAVLRKHQRMVMYQYIPENTPWSRVSVKLRMVAICAVLDIFSMLRKRGYTINLVHATGKDKGKPIPISHPDERKYVSWVSVPKDVFNK